MAIPAGYIQMQNGNWVRQSDGAGPFSIDTLGNVAAIGQVALITKTPAIWITLAAVLVSAEVAIWTPQAGKRFRLMGYLLSAGGAAGNVTLKDGLAGATKLILPFATVGAEVQDSSFGNGILSAAVNNALTATGAALQTLSGYVFGVEE